MIRIDDINEVQFIENGDILVQHIDTKTKTEGGLLLTAKVSIIDHRPTKATIFKSNVTEYPVGMEVHITPQAGMDLIDSKTNQKYTIMNINDIICIVK